MAAIIAVLFIAALAVSGCAAQVADTFTDPCAPPAFTEAACYSPGGGVTRCPMGDGTYWDAQPTGNQVHWQYTDATQNNVAVLCTVTP